MERTLILRNRDTGLYVGATACTADAGQALRFDDRRAAQRFLDRHACEQGALEVIERRPSAAA